MKTYFAILIFLALAASGAAQSNEGLTFPNIITPNGDGMNDTFIIGQYTLENGPSLTVYNRWGKTIFEAQRYANQWDASLEESGQYFYIIKYSDGAEYTGWLQILKG